MTRCKRGPRGERADHLAVNAQAIVQLYKSDADDDHLRIVEQQASGLRLWTKAPSWGGEAFLLGPAAVETAAVRVVCIHRNLGGIAKKTPGKYATFGMRFGRRRAPPEGIVDDDLGGSLAKNRGSEPTSEIELSLSQLFLLGKAGPRNASKGLVGWFALTPPRRGPPPAELLTGDLKLGFKLRNPHLLENLSPGQRERIQKYPKRYIDVLNGSSRGMSPPPPKLRKSPKAAPRTPPRTPPVPVLAAPPRPRKYCSTDCQRVDWRDRGHRKACKKIRDERAAEAARAEAPTPPPSPPVYGPAPRSGADEVRARIAAEHEAARARREAEPEPEKTDAEHLAMLKKNVANEVPEAITALAVCYRDGDYGLVKSAKKAAKLYKRAVELGDVKAMTSLGVYYKNGNGVKMDEAKAKQLYRMAADRGDYIAQMNLGGLLLAEKNDDEAYRWFLLAAQQGFTAAELQVGIAHGAGWGVAKDYVEANVIDEMASEIAEMPGRCGFEVRIMRAMFPEPPPDIQLRFDIGARVECRMEDAFCVGTVVDVWYREQGMTPGFLAPYQVELDEHEPHGRFIMAPEDDDHYIRSRDRPGRR
ncbi:hypothetical protein JL722_13629 [Aureococcus anophagefferens]|nr:hypothetical protein JL722_13629 [Aureococcus anophagefferens]